MTVRDCVSVTCHRASFPGSTWVCKNCMKASILFSLLFTFTFPNKKTIVSPSLPPGVPGETLLGARARINYQKNKKKKTERRNGSRSNKTFNSNFIRCKV